MTAWISPDGMMELRLGRWQDCLADVIDVDAVITDPPFSAKTHKGHRDGVGLAGGGTPTTRRHLGYGDIVEADVPALASRWPEAPWMVVLTDSELTKRWDLAFQDAGRTTFQPLPCVMRGMTVRLAGDGPSSWAVYAMVARTKAAHRWGTLPGAYVGTPGKRIHIGGKPLWLMRALIRDYSRPGDLIVDPYAGVATTLLATAIEGRRAIGAEVNPETYDIAVKRLARGYAPSITALMED